MTSHTMWRLLGGLALALLAGTLASAAYDDEDKEKDKETTDARKVAIQELQEQGARHLASRIGNLSGDVWRFLDDNTGFAPTAKGFTLDAHSYMDLPDSFKIRLLLRAREAAKPNTSDILLAALSRAMTVTETATDPSVLFGRDRKEFIDGYTTLRKALNSKFDLKEGAGSAIEYKFPTPPARPELTEDIRGRIAVLARYLSDPRNGSWASLQRIFGKTPTQALDALSKHGNLQGALEAEMAGLEDFEELFKKLVQRLNAEAKKNKNDTLEKIAILWPDRKPGTVKGLDDLPPPVRRTQARFPMPPEPNMKPEERAAEYRKYNEEGGSLAPKEVRKRVSYPAGVYYVGAAKAEDLPKPEKLRYEADKEDPLKGKLVVAFKDQKGERSLNGVSAEEARAAWEIIFGKDAAKPGDGIPLLGLEDGGGSYHEITRANVRRGERRSIVLHPGLLDTHLAAACMWLEVVPNNRTWLMAQLEADPSLGPKGDRSRLVLKALTDWAFDPWHNLDTYYPGRRQSLFRLTDVPLVIRKGSEDDTLRVARDSEDFDEWTRGRVFVEMNLMVQMTKDDNTPKGDPEEVAHFVRQSYLVIADLLQTSPEIQRLNNFAAVLGVVRWAKTQGAEYTEPAKPEAALKTPESIGVFSDAIIPLSRLKPDEVQASEEKRLNDKLTELSKSAGMKQYTKAWEAWWEAKKNDEDTGPAVQAQARLEQLDPNVGLYERVVRGLYLLKVDGLYAKHRGKDRKVNQEKVKEDLKELLEAVKKDSAKKPVESGIAFEMLEELAKRAFTKPKDDA